MLANKYLNGEVNRQDYLETVLSWISAREGIKLEDYMSIHQHDSHATPLWQYFQSVINWVQTIFPKYRKEMKGLAWGLMYNTYGDKIYNPQELEAKIVKLMQDDDVTKRSGIYEYLLSGNEKHLNIRAFTDNEKDRFTKGRAVYVRIVLPSTERKRITSLKKWRQTILRLGVKAARQMLITVRCFAKNTTEENQTTERL